MLTLYIYTKILTALTVMPLGVWVLSVNRSSTLNRVYFAFSCLLAAWAVTEFFVAFQPTAADALLWLKANYLFWPVSISVLLHLSLVFADAGSKRRWLLVPVYFPAALISAAAVLPHNPLGLSLTRIDWAWNEVSIATPYTDAIYIWAGIYAAIALCLFLYRFFKPMESNQKIQSLWFLAGFSIPILAGIVTGILIPILTQNAKALNYALQASIPGFVLMAYAIWRFELFSVNLKIASENLLSMLTDPFLLLNNNDVVLFANHAALSLLENGITPLTGMDFNAKCRLNPAAPREFTWRKEDGSLIPISISRSDLLNRFDEKIGTVILGRDLTERKNAEKAILESAGNFQKLFSEMKSGCTLQKLVCDTNGTPIDYITIDMNAAAEQLLGFGKEVVLGKSVRALLPPDEFEKWLTLFSKVALTGIPATYEQYSPSNQKMFEGLAFSPKPGLFATTFDDVTERKRAEEALQTANKLKSIGVLAGGIAHDFNNLLQSLFSYMDMAKRYADKGDAVHSSELLAKAAPVFDRTQALTQQLLTFSKGGTPVRKPQPIEKLLTDAVTFALSGSNITPIFKITGSLLPCSIDSHQIAQVLDNIIINARQSMPLGGSIEVSGVNVAVNQAPPSLAKQAYVRISIRDQGTGIAAEHLPHIFVPFFTTKSTGSGLGLATCYSIISKHDGLIEVESELGKGTVFHIYLPVSDLVSESSPLHAVSNTSFEGKLLLLDDEEALREAMSEVMTELGFTVSPAANADEALALVKQAKSMGESFKFAILDLTIPGGRGGKEVVRELAAVDASLLTIATSGYAEDPILANPTAYGFKGAIAKPYTIVKLEQTLKSLLV